MNLRLSRDSIRIRVELNETLELLDQGLLTESLPLGNGGLELRVESTHEGKPRLDELSDRNGMRFLVPLEDLKQLIVNHEKRTPKVESELKMNSVLGGREIEVRFEIDRFTRKKEKENERKAN